MSNTFFTADQHFNHARIIDYCNRPFTSVEHMNETLIANWNGVVKQSDTVFILGDFAFGSAMDTERTKMIIRQLNGSKVFIIGSHDKVIVKINEGRCIPPLNLVKGFFVFKEKNVDITLCHYAMRTWSKSHYNTWHLFGHSHGKLEGFGKSFDCGVDAWGFTPLSLEQVRNEMVRRPDNFNLVRRNE